MGSIWIVASEKEAELLADPIRREILRLLAQKTLTGSELSKLLGLSPPAVAHHLQALEEEKFITVERIDTETHGLERKYLKANAQAFIVDRSRLPTRLRRYFTPADIERARGIIASMALFKEHVLETSTGSVEKLCDDLNQAVLELARERAEEKNLEDPEKLVGNLYREALRKVLKLDISIIRKLPNAG